MGHKNKIKLSKNKLNKLIYDNILKIIKNNNKPIIISKIEDQLKNYKINNIKILSYINKEFGNIFNFINQYKIFKLININSNLFIDINSEWIIIDNPIDNIHHF